jgi:hypothetical protein
VGLTLLKKMKQTIREYLFEGLWGSVGFVEDCGFYSHPLHTLISTEQTPKILHDEIYTKHWLSCWETSKFIRDKNN